MKNAKLEAAHRAWQAGAVLRQHRARYKDFTYGRQWGDLTEDSDGSTVTEGALARRSGKRPLTNNLIRQLVKSIVGRWRHSLREGEVTMPAVDDETAARNQLDELDARTLEEFLISGCAIQRVVSERRPGGEGVWVDNVSPARFFANRFRDPRSSDIELAGMLHDMSEGEIVMRFGHGDSERVAAIEADYNRLLHSLAGDGGEWGECGEPGRRRVIEVWTLESRDVAVCRDMATGCRFTVAGSDAPQIAGINRSRSDKGEAPVLVDRKVSLRWHCTWFTPSGMVLDEYDSPWPHGLHPFVVKFYPMTDGEVHSFVEDVIDQQKYINRLITLIDNIMGHSAKGVLLYPINSSTSGNEIATVAEQWSSPNSIITYDPAVGGKPEQVTSSGLNAGASELLSLEMRLIEQISGVSGALQGQLPARMQSVEGYRASIENATIALLDIFESFRAWVRSRNERIINSGFANKGRAVKTR